MSSVNLGRVAFVYRGDFVPGKEYCRYDIVAAHGNLYHCMGLEMYAYNKIDVDEAGNVIGLDANWWELFLKGTGGYVLKAGAGIEVEKDDLGNWTIKNIATVTGGNNIDVKTTTSGNTVTYKVTGLHQPITSSTLKIKHYTDIDEKTKVKVDGYEVDWPLGKTEGIDIKQSSDGKWNFTAKTSKVDVATWEKWWIKYPWDINLVKPTTTYSGPMHFSSNSLNIIGMTYGNNIAPCISDDGSMCCIVDGKTIPVVKWDVQYDLSVSYSTRFSTLLEGLEFQTYKEVDGDVVANTPQKMYYDPTREKMNASTNGCFVVTGPNGYTLSWSSAGYGGTGGKTHAYTGTLTEVDNIGLIFCIINRPDGNEGWHLHSYMGFSNLAWNHSTGVITSHQIYSDGTYTTLLGDADKMTGPDNWYAFKLVPSKQDQPVQHNVNNWFVYKLSDEEKKKYLSTDKTGMITSTAEVSDDNVQFKINVLGKDHLCEAKKSDCINYNIIFDDDAESYTATISYSNLPAELIYTFEDNCILDIDKNNQSKNKRVYKIGDKISIPYYSGCTFIKNT